MADNRIQKTFQTPPCLAMFLDVEATETGIDFDPLPEASAQRLAPGAALGIEQTTRRARPRGNEFPTVKLSDDCWP